MESTEIQLFSNTFNVSQLTSQETRENLYLSINQLDVNKLSDLEIRQNFNGIKVALGVFISRFIELEGEIKDIRLQQVAYESRMEKLFVKGRMEIQELKQEIESMRNRDRHMEKVVEVAKLLKNNDYAPMAIKSMMKGITQGEILTSIKFSDDMQQRLEFAQLHGFRWNKNNRAPSKVSKRIELLEGWELEFYKAKSLTQDRLLDKEYVLAIGKGGPAGALVAIEEVLGYRLEERKSLSVYNCYQRAIKILVDKIEQNITNPPTIVEVTDFVSLVRAVFGKVDFDSESKIVKGLSNLPNPRDPRQILSQLKIYFSADLLPRFIEITEETNRLKLLPKLQSDFYDNQLTEVIMESLHCHQEQ